jgi:dethiobiotin synthetase
MGNFFISAIDTEIGKTYVTGFLARYLRDQGQSVMTMKLVETGTIGISQDITQHRKAMGISLTKDDNAGFTCPYVFPYPASPHYAGQLAQTKVEMSVLLTHYHKLKKDFSNLLVEGAGGLLTPLNEEQVMADFVEHAHLPVILVTNGKLGSINQTLLNIKYLESRGIELKAIVYNEYPGENLNIINSSRTYLREKIGNVVWIDLEKNRSVSNREIDKELSLLFEI